MAAERSGEERGGHHIRAHDLLIIHPVDRDTPRAVGQDDGGDLLREEHSNLPTGSEPASSATIAARFLGAGTAGSAEACRAIRRRLKLDERASAAHERQVGLLRQGHVKGALA